MRVRCTCGRIMLTRVERYGKQHTGAHWFSVTYYCPDCGTRWTREGR